MNDRKCQQRLALVAILLGVVLLGLLGRVVYLHLLPSPCARKELAGKGDVKRSLQTRRGKILDGSPAGNMLAVNIGYRHICADPSIVVSNQAVDRVVSNLSQMLNLDARELTASLDQPTNRFVFIQRFVAEETAKTVMKKVGKLKLPGVYTQEATRRQYPQGSFLSQVIGFVGAAGTGGSGVEQSMERFLKGCPGMVESKRDGRGRELYGCRTMDIDPEEGADVYLTIDQNIQYIAEKALDRAMETNRARSAWVIIERIRSGEILAMASRPTYSLNEYRAATEEMKLNRAIGRIYEPGSTFKPAIVAAAINEGLVTSSTVFDCENGRWWYLGKLLRDYHPYGNLSVADVVKKSSNIGAAKIALTLGETKVERYLRDFYIGRKMGIDLPGEETGILRSSAKWSKLDITRIAMGQSVSVTALQMLGVITAIANDGFLMRPYVVRRVVAKDGTVLQEGTPQVLSRPISGETAAIMRQILTRVTEEGGTGTRAAVAGYKVAGKTGSAQKPEGGRYNENDYWATFAGFLPADNPEIAIIITLEEPQPLHTGGLVAAPVFGEIAEQAVRYLDIPPPQYYTVAGK